MLAIALCVATTTVGIGTLASGASGNSIPGAQQALGHILVRPQHLPTSDPITKPIPKGKTIDWIQCSLSDCTILTPPLKAAAAALGWTIRVIPAGVTPETVKNAWDVAVADHPDGVVATGFPKSIFASELAALSAANIPVVDGFVADTSGGGITAVVQGNNTNQKIGIAMADAVLAKRGSSANTLLISSSTFPTLAKVESGYMREYKRLCANCKVSTLDEQATSFGSTLPGDVVAYLRSHPGINSIVPDEGAMAIGIPQALATAGIKNMTIVGQYPDPTTAQYLKSGQMSSIVMPQETDSMWQMIDALARFYAGQPTAPSEAASPVWAVTSKTVGRLKQPYYLIPNYASKYKHLWGVNG
jgi:ABC-type sugar transport system substrate-binding protein